MKLSEYRRLLEDNTLSNAKYSWSAKGGPLSKGKYRWTKDKQNLLISNIKKQKYVKGYRTYSLSEKEWFKMFDDGYTEIYNINTESGLTAFSTDKKMINRFRGGGEITIVLEIYLKKYIKIDESFYPEEKEILTNNLKWKVSDIDDTKSYWYIKGEQI